ncbi:MAG: hypothetical protein MPN21_27545, partial [Thermoanaerobaculia bacterium]|nr:hypothetical protein [Thermoanaerobaculia bacterium]
MHHLTRILVPLALVASHAFPGHASVDEWTASGPEGGSITALVIDPVTPSTVYAGTDGGVFKSVDSGANWSVSNDGLTDSFISSLAIDPSSPSTLYAGTIFDGVFKSTNAGSSWFPTPRDGIGTVLALAVDPHSPTTVYSATTGGVFKTINGGENWSAINSGLTQTFITALAIDPRDTSTVFAGTLSGAFK